MNSAKKCDFVVKNQLKTQSCFKAYLVFRSLEKKTDLHGIHIEITKYVVLQYLYAYQAW